MQQLQLVEEKQLLAASAALQPIAARGFCSSDTAFARSQAAAQISDCLVALVSQHLAVGSTETLDASMTERIRNAISSMFSAASIPRLASASADDREEEMVQLAYVLVGLPLSLALTLLSVASITYHQSLYCLAPPLARYIQGDMAS